MESSMLKNYFHSKSLYIELFSAWGRGGGGREVINANIFFPFQQEGLASKPGSTIYYPSDMGKSHLPVWGSDSSIKRGDWTR